MSLEIYVEFVFTFNSLWTGFFSQDKLKSKMAEYLKVEQEIWTTNVKAI